MLALLVAALLPLDLVAPVDDGAARVTGCDEAPPLVRRALADAWHPARKRDVDILACASGRFPSPAWYVVALEHHGAAESAYDGDFTIRRAIVGGDGIRASTVENASFTWRRGDWELESVEAIDLDGDGTDEVLESRAYDRRCYAQHWLYAIRVGRGALSWTRVLTSCSACESHTREDSRWAGYEADVGTGAVRGAIALTVVGRFTDDNGVPAKRAFQLCDATPAEMVLGRRVLPLPPP